MVEEETMAIKGGSGLHNGGHYFSLNRFFLISVDAPPPKSLKLLHEQGVFTQSRDHLHKRVESK